MNNTIYLIIQTTMGLIAYGFILKFYVAPKLKDKEFGPAILPFLILHIFRYLGLVLLVQGQIDPSVSRDALAVMAYGDLASGVCALAAAFAISKNLSFATPLVILFTFVGIIDFILVSISAAMAGIVDAEIGTMWFMMVIFAPALLITQLYIAYRLLLHLRTKVGKVS